MAIIGSSGDAEVTRVQSVYQTDLNELKGDLADVKNTFNTRLVNIKLSLTDEGLLHIEEVSA